MCMFFFFKQKTAYEMRISDWSADVCSSDLPLDEPLPSVLIGAVEPPETHHGVMLNLGLEVPDWFSRFERVLEIVAADAEGRAKSRERYKFYRDRGYELATHKLCNQLSEIGNASGRERVCKYV